LVADVESAREINQNRSNLFGSCACHDGLVLVVAREGAKWCEFHVVVVVSSYERINQSNESNLHSYNGQTTLTSQQQPPLGPSTVGS
jgi:hypothetical protein